MSDETDSELTSSVANDVPEAPAPKVLTPQAQRALAEAEARRADIDARASALPVEHDGRNGPEPVRYGDWEVKGIASDF